MLPERSYHDAPMMEDVVTRPARIAAMIGGSEVLGEVRRASDLARWTRRGLPVAAVDALLRSRRMTVTELDKVALARKTLSHRRKLGTLSAAQSERLVRLARGLAETEETFGDIGKAAVWLRRPTAALDGGTPLDLLKTDEGARRVEVLLGRISHGIAA